MCSLQGKRQHIPHPHLSTPPSLPVHWFGLTSALNTGPAAPNATTSFATARQKWAKFTCQNQKAFTKHGAELLLFAFCFAGFQGLRLEALRAFSAVQTISIQPFHNRWKICFDSVQLRRKWLDNHGAPRATALRKSTKYYRLCKKSKSWQGTKSYKGFCREPDWENTHPLDFLHIISFAVEVLAFSSLIIHSIRKGSELNILFGEEGTKQECGQEVKAQASCPQKWWRTNRVLAAV